MKFGNDKIDVFVNINFFMFSILLVGRVHLQGYIYYFC